MKTMKFYLLWKNKELNELLWHYTTNLWKYNSNLSIYVYFGGDAPNPSKFINQLYKSTMITQWEDFNHFNHKQPSRPGIVSVKIGISFLRVFSVFLFVLYFVFCLPFGKTLHYTYMYLHNFTKDIMWILYHCPTIVCFT